MAPPGRCKASKSSSEYGERTAAPATLLLRGKAMRSSDFMSPRSTPAARRFDLEGIRGPEGRLHRPAAAPSQLHCSSSCLSASFPSSRLPACRERARETVPGLERSRSGKNFAAQRRGQPSAKRLCPRLSGEGKPASWTADGWCKSAFPLACTWRRRRGKSRSEAHLQGREAMSLPRLSRRLLSCWVALVWLKAALCQPGKHREAGHEGAVCLPSNFRVKLMSVCIFKMMTLL